MSDSGSSGLAAKLAKITGQMERIPKTGVHPQGWAFATEGDISDALRPLLAEAGIQIIPSLVTSSSESVEGRNGSVMMQHHVEVEYAITDGSDTMKVRWAGEAFDTSDKGLAKAMTACRKTLFINLFMIATGDRDIEQDYGDHAPAPARSFQRQEPVSYQPQRPTTTVSGATPPQGDAPRPKNPDKPASEKQRNLVGVRASNAGLSEEFLDQGMRTLLGHGLNDLTMGDVDDVLKMIEHFANTGELPSGQPSAGVQQAASSQPAANAVNSAEHADLVTSRYEELIKYGEESAGMSKAEVNAVLTKEGINVLTKLMNPNNPSDTSIVEDLKKAIDKEAIPF